MLVRDWMSVHPVTIAADTPVTEALRVMRESHVRRLPVLDKEGNLLGIVSEKDLLYAAPSPATSLNIYELHYLLSHLLVGELMTRDVIVVTPETSLEEAARQMTDRKIGGLPVIEMGASASGKLVGIITQTDIFKVFLELLAARQKGVRITLRIPERKGEIARLTTAIAGLGGNILALVTAPTDDPAVGVATVKVEDVPTEVLLQAIRDLGLEIVDAREI